MDVVRTQFRQATQESLTDPKNEAVIQYSYMFMLSSKQKIHSRGTYIITLAQVCY